MSKTTLRFFEKIYENDFGKTVREVAAYIQQNYECMVEEIKTGVSDEITLKGIMESLLILQQHNLLLIGPEPKSNVGVEDEEMFCDEKIKFDKAKLIFALDEKALARRIHFPKYLVAIEGAFPNIGAFHIVEHLMVCGQASEDELKQIYDERNAQVFRIEKKSEKKLSRIEKEEREIFKILDIEAHDNYTKDESETAFFEVINKLLSNRYLEIIEPLKPGDEKSKLRFYRINDSRFAREIVNNKIEKFVSRETDSICSAVVSAMLKASSRAFIGGEKENQTRIFQKHKKKLKKKDNSDNKKDKNRYLSAQSIFSIIEKTNSQKNNPKDPSIFKKTKVTACLIELSNGKRDPFVLKSPSGVKSFCLNREGILKRMKTAKLHSVVRLQFGEKSARIFKLLVIKSQLEEMQISDMALIPRQEVRSRLYELLNHNLAFLKELPMNPQDPNSNKMFYLWSVPLKIISGEFLEGVLYKTWISYNEKQELEEKLLKKWLEFSREEERKNRQAIERKIERIKIAKGRVEDTISLFSAE